MYSLPQSYNQTSKCKRGICPNAYIYVQGVVSDTLRIIVDCIILFSKGFQNIKEGGIIDIESTYPFFRTTVLQLMGTGNQPTKTSVNVSLANIAKAIGILAPIGFAAGPIGLGILLGAAGFAGASLLSLPKIGKSIYPLISLTEMMLKKKK